MVGQRRRGRAWRGRASAGLILLVLGAGPPLLWHRVIVDLWRAFHPDAHYLLGWTPWALLAAGIAFFVPVTLSVGADPDGRFYPRARNAYFGWGITLYLLGLGLASQVARIHDGAISGF